MKKKLSIHDLARQLSISATTISFVINGKGTEKGISRDLQKRVLKHIKEVGFQPNLVAQSLRTGKSKIIGMLVEDISDRFFSEIARKVEELAYVHDYKIFFASTENDTAKTKVLIRVFRDRQVDGYIIAPPPGIENEISALLEDGSPVILFDRYFKGVQTNNVVIDNFGGTYKAMDHLKKNGFPNIGFITLISQQIQMRDRLRGYITAMDEAGLKKCILEVPYNNPAESTVKKIKAFINKNKKLDALLFATNYLTDFGLEAINQLALEIPRDLAVVSFDDNAHFPLLSPSITAVAQPMKKISEQVVKMLMACLTNPGENNTPQTIVLPAELITRNSSKRINNGKVVNIV